MFSVTTKYVFHLYVTIESGTTRHQIAGKSQHSPSSVRPPATKCKFESRPAIMSLSRLCVCVCVASVCVLESEGEQEEVSRSGETLIFH